MNRCRILVVPGTDWLGGPETRLHRIFEDNLKKGFDVEVFHLPVSGRQCRKTSLSIHRPFCLASRGSTGLFHLLNTIPIWISLVRRIAVKKPHVLVTTNPIAVIPIALMKGGLGTKLVVDYADDLSGLAVQYAPRFVSSPLAKLVGGIVRYVLRSADRVIASSRRLQVRANQLSCQQVVLITNGVDITLFRGAGSLSHNNSIVGYVGGIYNWSGVEEFISTFPAVSATVPDVEYHIYGSGQSAEQINQLADAHDGVFYHGEIPYKRVPEVMRGFDVGVIPFIKNPLTDSANPIKLFEYWAAGMVVVSRNIDEVRRIGSDGVLCYDTVDELVQCLLSALISGEERTRLLSRSSSMVDDYNWAYLSSMYHLTIRESLGMKIPENTKPAS